MTMILAAPDRYVQGPGEMDKLGERVDLLGKKALCLISSSGFKRVEKSLLKTFRAAEVKVIYEHFNKECTRREIARIVKICKNNGVDVIIGIGGGKTHDTAKGVAIDLDIPVVIVPTAASTDAPCSAQCVVYDDNGIFEEHLYMKKNPDLVLVDTEMVIQAPVRFLVSGMGDALATYFETRACKNSGALNKVGGTATLMARHLSDLCYETLLTYGSLAKAAAEEGTVTKAFEKIVEANILLSGIGFESGGIAAAHCIHMALSNVAGCKKYHGEKVAFGTLVQLVLEDAPHEDIDEVLAFCTGVDLPLTLEDLDIKYQVEETIKAVAAYAVEPGKSIHNMPFPVTADGVYTAIMTADAIGRRHKLGNA